MANEENYHLGAKALIRNKNGEILLLKVNPAYIKEYINECDTEPYWDTPGGRVKKGATIEETLRSEVEEETGITSIKSFKPLSMVLSKLRIPVGGENVGLILATYTCEVGALQEIRLSREHIQYQWTAPKEAAKLLKTKYPPEFTNKIKNLV